MPQFTVDWFCHNIASWERVFDSLGRLKTDESIKALEVRDRTQRELQLIAFHYFTVHPDWLLGRPVCLLAASACVQVQ